MESNRWLFVAVLAGGVLIGAAAYTAGLSEGAAHAAVAAGNADGVDWRGGWHAWNGYWGGPFAPFLTIFLWAWIFRMLFWGFSGPWGWRRRWRYYDSYYDDPRRFEEWHRRAHEVESRKSKVESQ
jgi:hypothetical protein